MHPSNHPSQPAKTALMSAPTLSVIVPVYNSNADLMRCLDALVASTCNNFDVLVVDDGSIEPLEPIVTRHSYRYMRIDGPHGPARARNRGAQNAQGLVLVFIDADVCVHHDTLDRMGKAFITDPSLAALVGTYDDAPDHPAFISQYMNLFHRFVHQRSSGQISTFWAGCGAIRRDVFLQFGGFDEHRYQRPSIEDIELGMRISVAQHRIILDDRVQCTHLKHWTFWNMLKTDIFARGIPWVRLLHRFNHVDNKLNVSRSQRVSVMLVYLTIASVLLALWFPVHWATVLTLGAFVTILNLDLYRYFIRTRGTLFTLRAIPMHWLYFMYCGICVGAGTAMRFVVADHRPVSTGPSMSVDATGQ